VSAPLSSNAGPPLSPVMVRPCTAISPAAMATGWGAAPALPFGWNE